ncbi:prospero homeobox protein 1-like isoform X2 [Alosa sapidissima]|uniref:prospero homeobox protein 1-like isoform X2 n=1 Tax=Alosa sapidissima TaxID=34773 RepID=UPI001C0923D3|nr:prospero homeobox protein 1-like isoform X2 [Alosa sapidissima]
MPEQPGESPLNRQTKRRRVDIGVKRTVGSSASSSAPVAAPPTPSDIISATTRHAPSDIISSATTRHAPSDIISATTAANILGAGSAIMSHGPEHQDLLDCPLSGPLASDGNGGGEVKSNVLRKLLKRANSYEDAMMPFAGATIISQLLKSNMAKGPHPASDIGSDIAALQDDACSDPSSSRGDSPHERLSPFGRPPALTGAGPGALETERLSDEHLRAKRARVENIIRGMSHSPSVPLPTSSSSSSSSSSGARNGEREREHERERNGDVEGPAEADMSSVPQPSSPRESYRENKRKQKLPQQQQTQTQTQTQGFQQGECVRSDQRGECVRSDQRGECVRSDQRGECVRSDQRGECVRADQRMEERRQLKLQLEDMQKQLRQLQEKFFQMYDSTDSEGHDPDNDPDNDPGNDPGNLSEDSGGGGARSDGGLDDSAADRSDNDMSDLDPGHFLDRARALLRGQALLDRAKPRRETPPASGKGPVGSIMHAEGKQLAETLKQELNSAMSQVVDTVVKVFAKPPGGPRTHTHAHARTHTHGQPLYPPLHAPPDRFSVNGADAHPNLHTANARLQCFGDVIIPSPLESFGGVPLPGANDQTEAIPLVVRKAPSEHHQSSAVGAHGAHHHPALHPSSLSASMGFAPPSFRPPFPLPLMGYPFQGALGGGGYSGKDRSSPDSMDLSRETTSLRTKMASGASSGGHHLGGHLGRSCSPTHAGSTAEGLSLALIKSECGDLQDMADMSPYSGSTIQEGLSPNHLKKAKLMFFYSRYPSSNMLKMFFSDVKFNRCITSQLIKWFSNFREFYYIQMEKFARQAINEGVTAADDINVSRDSELFRALNMHYNKANDFEVPERFLEVAQITMREFFNAIVAGKDVDPSWKKAIYKVICKLDSEVPEVFKSPNCLQELLHE